MPRTVPAASDQVVKSGTETAPGRRIKLLERSFAAFPLENLHQAHVPILVWGQPAPPLSAPFVRFVLQLSIRRLQTVQKGHPTGKAEP